MKVLFSILPNKKFDPCTRYQVLKTFGFIVFELLFGRILLLNVYARMHKLPQKKWGNYTILGNIITIPNFRLCDF